MSLITVIKSGSTDTNLYNSNGTLTGNRTVTGGGFSLKFTGQSNFSIVSPSASALDTAWAVRNNTDTFNLIKTRGDGVTEAFCLAVGSASANFPVIGAAGQGYFEATFIAASQEIRIKDTGVISLGGGFTTIRQNNFDVNISSYYGTQIKNYNDGLINTPPSTLLDLQGTSGFLLLPRMTATQASAHTPSNGHVGYITSTNGTFTTVGIWGYENGVWVKL